MLVFPLLRYRCSAPSPRFRHTPACVIVAVLSLPRCHRCEQNFCGGHVRVHDRRPRGYQHGSGAVDRKRTGVLPPLSDPNGNP